TTTAISYQAVTSLVLNTGSGPDHVNLESTPGPTAVNTGDGADQVTVAAQARNLDVIGGPLTLNGSIGANQLQINDQNNARASTWQVTGTSIDRTSVVPGQASVHVGITYGNIQTLAVGDGAGDDTINVQGTSADTTLSGGAGLNTINVGNTAN